MKGLKRGRNRRKDYDTKREVNNFPLDFGGLFH
jgi:hypothetical protein